MRVKVVHSPFTALAIAGNHVVLLGWDIDEELIRREDILGFSISRLRHEDGERVWLRCFKTFASIESHLAAGVTVSTFRHPIQSFQWADYSVASSTTYTYRVVAVVGAPGALVASHDVELTVTTESTELGKHAVYFNRGAVASQEYARRFFNRPPDEVGPAAYTWLSRGLIEGLERFIAQATQGDELCGAFFEFKNSRIHAALDAARKRGALVSVLYDGDSQGPSNQAALATSGVTDLVKARIHSGGYAHNKFLVLRRQTLALEVWTGSTNLSENGIFGHSNNAHLVRDQGVAEKYFAYWKILFEDATRAPTAKAVEALETFPAPELGAETLAVFSPRKTLDVLDWYARLAGNAERALFTTFAFGMNERFAKVYDRTDAVLRFALMEKKGNGATFQEQAQEIDRIRQRPNVVVSVGHRIELNAFDRWLAEIDHIVAEAHVLYVHTKYMLIDPLGSNPIVIVGSANFSEASTNKNDENMLLIHGNPGLADIYLGEFMRLFSHYAFRESLGFRSRRAEADEQKGHLIESSRWIDGEHPGQGYFVPGSARALRRLYFSGQ
jgi:phosphatidylserine/phosphatidylglycerophosphate/cardiolipin synthase-like enzyme